MSVITVSVCLVASLIASVVDTAPAFHSHKKSTLSSSCSPTCADPHAKCSDSINCEESCGCESGLLMDERQERCVTFWQCSMPDGIPENPSKYPKL